MIRQPEAARSLPEAGRRERGTRPADRNRAQDIIPAVIGELVDALQAGEALADGDGSLALVRRLEEMLDTIITSLFQVGLSLQGAIDLPAEMTGQRIAEALWHLDDSIREIRVTAFAGCDRDTPPHLAAG